MLDTIGGSWSRRLWAAENIWADRISRRPRIRTDTDVTG